MTQINTVEPGDTALRAVITEVWAANDRDEDEILVTHPLGANGFPYEDSSERRDQLGNARDFARKLFDEGRVAGVDDFVDAPVQSIERPR